MALQVRCEGCGRETHLEFAEFHQNIGLVYLRIHKQRAGEFCINCTKKYFWEMTLTSLFLGWWGVISFFVTPYFIIKNIINYNATLRDFKSNAGRTPPRPVQNYTAAPAMSSAPLPAAQADSLQPYTEEIITRLNAGESTILIARDIAARAGVSQERAAQYVTGVFRSNRNTPVA